MSRSLSLAVALALLAWPVAAAAGDGAGALGFVWGSSVDEILSQGKAYRPCEAGSEIQGTICLRAGALTVGNVTLFVYPHVAKKFGLFMVELRGMHHSASRKMSDAWIKGTVDSLTEKYGKPAVTLRAKPFDDFFGAKTKAALAKLRNGGGARERFDIYRWNTASVGVALSVSEIVDVGSRNYRIVYFDPQRLPSVLAEDARLANEDAGFKKF
jgi:hypothetical protein